MALSTNNIKPFTHEQALFIHRHIMDNPDLKMSELQKFFKKQCGLRKLPTIHQIRQCIRYGEESAIFIKKGNPGKLYDEDEMVSMTELFDYADSIIKSNQ
jgi:hypothetical protein